MDVDERRGEEQEEQRRCGHEWLNSSSGRARGREAEGQTLAEAEDAGSETARRETVVTTAEGTGGT